MGRPWLDGRRPPALLCILGQSLFMMGNGKCNYLCPDVCCCLSTVPHNSPVVVCLLPSLNHVTLFRVLWSFSFFCCHRGPVRQGPTLDQTESHTHNTATSNALPLSVLIRMTSCVHVCVCVGIKYCFVLLPSEESSIRQKPPFGDI